MTRVPGNRDEKEETKLSKRNYSQYSKKNESEVIEAFTPEVETEVVEAVDVVIEPVTEKIEKKPKKAVGVVSGCTKLNVRANADVTANVVCVLDAGSEVEMNTAKSTKDWVAVRTADGINGFCMRKYISAKA